MQGESTGFGSSRMPLELQLSPLLSPARHAMTVFLQKVSCVGWPLRVPKSGLPRLEIPEIRDTWSIFIGQKSLGRTLIGRAKVRCLYLNQSSLRPERRQYVIICNFPKENHSVIARWKGTGHWIMRATSAAINPTFLLPEAWHNHAVRWTRRFFSSSPAWIYITKEHAGKRIKEKSEYGKPARLTLTKMVTWKHILKMFPQTHSNVQSGSWKYITGFWQEQVFSTLNYDTKRLASSRNYILSKEKPDEGGEA